MAITGKSYVNPAPGKLTAGQPEVVAWEEASSQTGLRGEFVAPSSGYMAAGSVGGFVYGFLAEANNNLSTDGLSKVKVYRARQGQQFTATLKATLTQAMLGSSVALSRGSSTAYLDTATATSTHNCVVIGPVAPFAVGDTNALVYFEVSPDRIWGDSPASI